MESFQSLLPQENIRYVRKQLLQGDAELNSDSRPVTYYLNMILWSRFSASGFADWLEKLRELGPWPYLLPLLLLVPLWLLRSTLQGFNRARLLRSSSTLALMVLGIIASPKSLLEFVEKYDLDLHSSIETLSEVFAPTKSGVAEVVIPPRSDLVGKSARDVWLRKRFGSGVIETMRGVGYRIPV